MSNSWKTKRGNRLIFASLTVATITIILDYVFHSSLTSPMEVPAYFIAKFIGAFLVAYLMLPYVGSFLSAVIFTIGFDVYYGLFVAVLHIPGLSSSPTQIIEIAGFGSQCVNYTCDPITQGILFALWTFVHGAFFYFGALVGSQV